MLCLMNINHNNNGCNNIDNINYKNNNDISYNDNNNNYSYLQLLVIEFQ